MRSFIFLITCFLLVPAMNAQIRILRVERLPVPTLEQWNAPLFSPSGTELYLTNVSHDGIWQYSLRTGLLKKLTSDRGAGFDPRLSEDGSTITYRTTVVPGDHRTRVQQSVSLSVTTGTKTILHRANSVEIPLFIRNSVVVPERLGSAADAPLPADAPVTVLGTSDMGIRLLVNGVEKIIAPLGKGQYIWPRLSPDGKWIVAVEMDRGAFIADVNGTNAVSIGRVNAPQWTRSGGWVIGMDDRDDGHSVTGSEIIAVSADGTRHILLTDSKNVHEMFPAVSPAEDVIVAVTVDGTVLKLTYEEGR